MVALGRPSKMAERDLDHAFHASEEQEWNALVRPLVDRMYLVAADYGPMAMDTVTGIDRLLQRHARRWSDNGEAA